MRFPAKLEPSPEGFVVSFRDLPEAITQGEDREEALAMACDALLTAMDFYFEDQRLVPSPSILREGEEDVPIPPSAASKILLWNEMILQRVTPTELALRMKTIPQEINRLIDLHHTSKIDRVSQALQTLGRRLELQVS